MRVAVLVKQVPATENVKIDETTGTMIREGVEAELNPLDLHAVEEAVRLKERFEGTEVVVISMGPLGAKKAVKAAIAMGCDRGVLLSDRKFAGSDTLATARTLAAGLVHEGGFDLALSGERATDGETGQVGPEVAVMLDIPFSTYVSGIDHEGTVSVVVSRTVEDGIERQRLPLPCLLTVLRDINEPSMPTLSGKKAARRAELPVWSLDVLELSPEDTGLKGSPTRVVRIFHPQIARKPRLFRTEEIEKGIGELVGDLERLGVTGKAGMS